MIKSPKEVDDVRQRYRAEVREWIPRIWQDFVEEEMEEFGESSFFYCQQRSLPQPDPWEGSERQIQHVIQQDKQVVEYAKRLETRRKGNYLTKAVEQAESDDSDGEEE